MPDATSYIRVGHRLEKDGSRERLCIIAPPACVDVLSSALTGERSTAILLEPDDAAWVITELVKLLPVDIRDALLFDLGELEFEEELEEAEPPEPPPTPDTRLWDATCALRCPKCGSANIMVHRPEDTPLPYACWDCRWEKQPSK